MRGTMEHIAIGKSGLQTSRIGLGTWAIGGWMWGGTDEAQSIATIRSAVERGVAVEVAVALVSGNHAVCPGDEGFRSHRIEFFLPQGRLRVQERGLSPHEAVQEGVD